MNESSVGKYSNDNSILTLNPPPNVRLLCNQFNELTAGSNKKNPEHFINCRNLDTDEIQKMKYEPKSLSLFHINCCSLNKVSDLESRFIEIIPSPLPLKKKKNHYCLYI